MSRLSRPYVKAFQTQTLGATTQFGSKSGCGATYVQPFQTQTLSVTLLFGSGLQRSRRLYNLVLDPELNGKNPENFLSRRITLVAKNAYLLFGRDSCSVFNSTAKDWTPRRILVTKTWKELKSPCIHITKTWKELKPPCIHITKIWKWLKSPCIHITKNWKGLKSPCILITKTWNGLKSPCIHIKNLERAEVALYPYHKNLESMLDKSCRPKLYF